MSANAAMQPGAPEQARFPFLDTLRGWIFSLWLPPVRASFLRQIYFTGIQATAGVVLRGALVGTLVIAYMIRVLNADAEATTKILLLFVFREVGPLFAAILVILRSGSAVTSELALMQLAGETRTLRLLGVRVTDYLVLPRVAGFALATAALTFYFQAVTVLGGLVLAPLVIEANVLQLAEHFLASASLWDVWYSVVKSLAFGAMIALVCCYQGLRVQSGDLTAIPPAVTRAIMQSVGFVTLFNALFAYLVFGVFLFGLVRAAA